MPTDRINFLDLSFDRLTFEDVKDRLQSVDAATPYAYVVTPNVHHVVQVHGDPILRELYDDATLCVCDSRILRLLARLCGIQLPLIAGSDLVEALFADVIRPGENVAVIGGTDAFIGRLQARFPHFNFLHHDPPMGLRHNLDARRSAAAFIAATNARFAFVAVGTPQQEMIAWEARKLSGASGVTLCIGAGIDFLTGDQTRAPRFLRLLGLEWAHRLATNPRRLWRRYLVDGLKIVPIYIRWRARRGRKTWRAAALAFLLFAGAMIYGANSRGNQAQVTKVALTWELRPNKTAFHNLAPPDRLKLSSTEQADLLGPRPVDEDEGKDFFL